MSGEQLYLSKKLTHSLQQIDFFIKLIQERSAMKTWSKAILHNNQSY